MITNLKNADVRGRHEAGVALIIALILLMVLTMVAVVAMRTTTLDLKMAANQTIIKRTFQISEAARARIHDVLDDHSFYRGWPTAQGGTVPASSGFVVPADVLVGPDLLPAGPLQNFFLANNADHWDLRAAAIDMQLRIDEDIDGAYTSQTDMASDIFVSRITAVAAPGSDTSQLTGYEGLGAGVAGAGSHLYYRIIARAAGVGGSQALTDAHYRYVITN